MEREGKGKESGEREGKGERQEERMGSERMGRNVKLLVYYKWTLTALQEMGFPSLSTEGGMTGIHSPPLSKLITVAPCLLVGIILLAIYVPTRLSTTYTSNVG